MYVYIYCYYFVIITGYGNTLYVGIAQVWSVVGRGRLFAHLENIVNVD